MAKVNDIIRDGYYGEMIRESWKDEEYGINKRVCEVTYYEFMENLCEQIDESKDIIGTLERMVSGMDAGLNSGINTYPFG